MEKVTIIMKSVNLPAEVIAEHEKNFTALNVEGTYSGTCRKDAIWTLTGTVEDLRKVVYEHWLARGFYAPQEVMDQETMDLLGFKADPTYDEEAVKMEHQLRSIAI